MKNCLNRRTRLLLGILIILQRELLEDSKKPPNPVKSVTQIMTLGYQPRNTNIKRETTEFNKFQIIRKFNPLI